MGARQQACCSVDSELVWNEFGTDIVQSYTCLRTDTWFSRQRRLPMLDLLIGCMTLMIMDNLSLSELN